MKKIQQSYGYRLKPSQILKLHIEKKSIKKKIISSPNLDWGCWGCFKKKNTKKKLLILYIHQKGSPDL